MKNSIIHLPNTNVEKPINNITYENLPIYHSPYSSNYHPLFQEDFEFEELTVKFSVSSSENYEKAVFICRRLPNYKLLDAETGPHSFTINTYSDFFVYRTAIDRLIFLIYNWRSTHIYINKELVSSTDLKDMSWILIQRLEHCPVSLPPILVYDIDQEYWNIYRKPLIQVKRKRKKPKKDS